MTTPLPIPAPSITVMRGIALMSFAMLMVPLMDTVAKYLTASLPPLQITLGRFGFQMLFAFLTAAIGPGLATLKAPRLWPHLLRGFFLSGASACFFTALKTMPIADAIAIFFVEPMILTVLSALLLRESVGPRRWSAVFVGLIGAMIIIRPGFTEFGPTALLPLAAAFLFALYLVITRRLSGEGSMLSVQFSAGMGGAILLGALTVGGTMAGIEDATPVMPDLPSWGLLAIVGAISFFAHGLIVKAFAAAPASVLAPFNYLEIVSATLFGYLVFGDFPDGPTWFGIALIVGSGIYIAHREHRLSRAEMVARSTRTGPPD
ncbi:DMT family transporter [Stappia stellulata]|uniref:DMT family transporter n=1 Tax=Stappia TaxID=152161 RepID=UPI001CD40CA5|nr:DMT family transporter [Stappia stellulata]MCA1244642.1 DMT family transporter [Stappia stellulata]